MEIKLKSKKLFYDSVGQRHVYEGDVFFADKERALKLVEGGFVDVLERPVEKPVDKPKEIEKPKVVAKPKTAAKKTNKK